MRLASGDVGVALDHQLLNRDRAFDGRDDGGKFQQQPVAHRLDDAAALVGDQRPRRVAMLANRPRRPGLVLAHQAGVADDVDSHDRGEAAGLSHDAPPVTSHPSTAGCGTNVCIARSIQAPYSGDRRALRARWGDPIDPHGHDPARTRQSRIKRRLARLVGINRAEPLLQKTANRSADRVSPARGSDRRSVRARRETSICLPFVPTLLRPHL